MNLRRFLLEAATIVVAAVLCAIIANAIASRERKLALVGSYPNALVVPKRPVESATAAPVILATTDSAATVTTAATTTAPIVATATTPANPATTATATV